MRSDECVTWLCWVWQPCLLLLGARQMSPISRWRNLKGFEDWDLFTLNIVTSKYLFIKINFFSATCNFFPALYHDIITTFWIKKYEISLSCLSSLQGCTTSSTLYNNKAKNKNLNNADLWQRIVIRVVKMPSLDYYLYFWIYCVFSLCFMNRSDKNLH